MISSLTKRALAHLPQTLQQELKRWRMRRLIRKGQFIPQEPEMAIISRLLSRGSCAIDVGANVGHYTCHMSKCVGPEGRVLAFEPLLDAFAQLTANVQAAALNNVTLINAAASSALAQVKMEVPKFDTGMENWYRAHIASTGRYSVLCFPLDAIPTVVPVSLIKIDAEGHDLQVLEGAENLIRTSRPTLIVEAPHDGEIAGWLAARGYKITKADPQSPNIVATFDNGYANANANAIGR